MRKRLKTNNALVEHHAAERLLGTGIVLPYPRDWCLDEKSFEHQALKSFLSGLWENGVYKSYASSHR